MSAAGPRLIDLTSPRRPNRPGRRLVGWKNAIWCAETCPTRHGSSFPARLDDWKLHRFSRATSRRPTTGFEPATYPLGKTLPCAGGSRHTATCERLGPPSGRNWKLASASKSGSGTRALILNALGALSAV